jgi:hypothetical protein
MKKWITIDGNDFRRFLDLVEYTMLEYRQFRSWVESTKDDKRSGETVTLERTRIAWMRMKEISR